MKEETTTTTTTTTTKNTTKIIRNEDDDYELVKVIILGDNKTGKSSILRRYHYNEFELGVSSIGVDFIKKDYGMVNGKYYKIQIWDVNSCDRFRLLTHSYYKGAHGFMLLYDCTNQESFNNLQFWINEIINKSPNSNNSTIVIIGNKCDLVNGIKIDPIKSKQFCDSKSITSFQNVSAKDSININEPFEILFRQIIKKGHSQTVSPKHDTYENNNINKSCNIL
ncbi:Rab GTPase [Dictyostelium discoideum AX4]|uniref:Ras-related protein RabT1 n=1 Tax=Dictyostelium discoideum TaxID=44689 RepID=RABT1_DICDI|nr:Rab GTPase [Dictyostelium discoideum AX4]Q55EG6.1 RecName: Full=Ras-related protein RabT1; Flags: Precursor [Dictyostelium discoideum]EAL73044.1 Rab GTPase [Dictyostelium discoideum AX4]|eukprot:XP_647054.1 Rab GTPase [Dictyostelium discoideum AX4]